MVNPWHKYKKAPKRKKQALHALFAGLILFSVLYLVTCIFKITLCPIKNLFGVPCFGCGMTRAFIAIIHLNFKEAIRLHVLSIPAFAAITIYSILCFTDIIFERTDLERLSNLFGKKYMIILYLLLLVFSTLINYKIRT